MWFPPFAPIRSTVYACRRPDAPSRVLNVAIESSPLPASKREAIESPPLPATKPEAPETLTLPGRFTLSARRSRVATLQLSDDEEDMVTAHPLLNQRGRRSSKEQKTGHDDAVDVL